MTKPYPCFARLGFTPAQIQSARVTAADVNRRLVAALESNEFDCEDPAAWTENQRKCIAEIEAGESDFNFTIWQRMHFALTGKCSALLP